MFGIKFTSPASLDIYLISITSKLTFQRGFVGMVASGFFFFFFIYTIKVPSASWACAVG
jgi:hypothetical protein